MKTPLPHNRNQTASSIRKLQKGERISKAAWSALAIPIGRQQSDERLSTYYPSTRIVTDVAAQSAAGAVGTTGSLEGIGGVNATGSAGAGTTDERGPG